MQASGLAVEPEGRAAVAVEVEFPWALTATTTAIITMRSLEIMVGELIFFSLTWVLKYWKIGEKPHRIQSHRGAFEYLNS